MSTAYGDNGGIVIRETETWEIVDNSPIPDVWLDWGVSENRDILHTYAESEVVLYDTESWNELSDSPIGSDIASGEDIEYVDWSPGDEYMSMVIGEDGIYIYDTDTWEEIPESPIPYAIDGFSTSGITFSPMGNYFVAYDGWEAADVRIYNTDTWEEIPDSRIELGETNWTPKVSPDGKYLAMTVEDEVLVIDTNNWDNLTLGNNTGDTYWSPSSEYFAYVVSGDVYIVDTEIWEEVDESPLTGGTDFANWDDFWSPDHNYLAYTDFEDLYVHNSPGGAEPLEGLYYNEHQLVTNSIEGTEDGSVTMDSTHRKE